MPETNEQILSSIPEKNCCALVFLRTLFFFSSQEVEGGFLLSSSNEILEKAGKIISNFYPECELDVWSGAMLVRGNCFALKRDLDFENLFNLSMYDECCKLTMLKTLFLTCGRFYFGKNNNENSKGYNLEFVCKPEMKEVINTLLHEFGFDLKSVTRQKNQVIYTKNSALVCDLLVKLGAVYSSLEIQNSLAVREIRNQTNRQNNCFENNINKTLNSSGEQLRAINYIIDHYSIDYLDDSLKSVALARIANPDVSLNDLRTLLNNSISRAGIKYRLDKIISIYKSLKGEKE